MINGEAPPVAAGVPETAAGAPAPLPAGAPSPFPMLEGGAPFDLPPPPKPEALALLEQLAALDNVVTSDLVSEDDLRALAQQAHDGYERDKASRADWEEQAEAAMKAARQEREDRNYPFPNSANVKFPLIATAAMQFNARAYPAICAGPDVVRARIGGPDNGGAKAARAQRVGSFMSHQIVDGMPSWEHEMDVMLMQLPIVGCAGRKTFWGDKGPESKMVSAFDLIVNANTRSIETCPRISHRFPLYPYEIEQRRRRGTFADLRVEEESAEDAQDDQSEVQFVEQHCWYDLDGDGLAEPWIVTITEDGHSLMRVVAGFDPLDVVHDGREIVSIPRDEYFTIYSFLPDPDGGFYGRGFGQMLDSLSGVIDTSFNQMLDAGHLQNAGGGFIGDSLNFQDEAEEFRFSPGTYYSVTAEGGALKDNIVTLQHPGASPVLMKLIEIMMNEAKTMTSIQDILTGAASAQTMQPTTLMGLLDQGLKVFTATYKRIYDSLGREFRIIYRLNRKYLDDETYLAYVSDGPPADPSQMPSVQADFADDGCLVTPVADPHSVTLAQKMAVASYLMQLLMHPKIGPTLDTIGIRNRVLAAGMIDDVQSIIAKPAPPSPPEQLAVAKAVAEVRKLNADADHALALAGKDLAQTQHTEAQTADLIVGEQPDYYKNPGQE